MTEALDAWAVLAHLRDEPAAERVEQSMNDGAVMSWLNLGEVFYILHRHEGAEDAHQTVRDLRHMVAVELPDEARILSAATIKATHRVSYADAFAAATALAHDVPLLTGNPELLSDSATWQVVDLRAM